MTEENKDRLFFLRATERYDGLYTVRASSFEEAKRLLLHAIYESYELGEFIDMDPDSIEECEVAVAEPYEKK